MAIAYFPSLEDAETLEVVFLKPGGTEVSLRLLVDSAFSGRSCFVLPERAYDLAQAAAPASQATGALQGRQKRVVVSCRIPPLLFQRSEIAILADISRLALPAGIDGVAGLRFLRYFRRWGAERADDGAWRFFLATE
jgi:hypothetical protein